MSEELMTPAAPSAMDKLEISMEYDADDDKGYGDDNENQDTHGTDFARKGAEDPYFASHGDQQGSTVAYKDALRHHHKTNDDIRMESLYTNSAPDDESGPRDSTLIGQNTKSGI